MRRTFIIPILFLASVPLLIVFGSAWLSQLVNPVRKAEFGVGPFFRVTTELTYKGQPLKLEFGLACNGILTKYKDTSQSLDFFQSPHLYGVRTSDGKALVQTTYHNCEQLRARHLNGDVFPNGGIPLNYLPIMILYDDPETLAFGTAYMSDEAYKNARSVMSEPTTRFENITGAEWAELRRNGVKNVVHFPRNDGHSSDRFEDQPGKKPLIGDECYGWYRLPIPEEMRETIRQLWPADHPRYWQPNDDAQTYQLLEAMSRFKVKGFDLDKYRASGFSAMRAKGFVLDFNGGSLAPPYYPVAVASRNIWVDAESRWEPAEFRFNIEVAHDESRGFLYCYKYYDFTPRARYRHRTYEQDIVANKMRQLQNNLAYKNGAITIDGTAVRYKSTTGRGRTQNFGPPIFESDEYIFISESISIGNGGEQIDDYE